MEKFHRKSFVGIYLIAFLAIFLYACKKEGIIADQASTQESSQTTTTLGKAVTFCHGKATSFVTKDSKGNPICIGFSFSEEALRNLPDSNFMTEIPVPANNGTLVDHISFDFNAHGHEPPGIYDKAHFDVHFYMIPQAEQNMIVIGPEMEVLPAAEFIPTDYQANPGGVPMMGKHWADVTSKEFHGQPFDRTFIYGSYNGKFIFFEPMITLAFFQSKQSFTDEVKTAAKVQREGYYPKAYSVTYDAATKIYTIFLNQLTFRSL